MYGTLEDWIKRSPRKNIEGWVKINEALEFFVRLSAISLVVGYILKERLLMKSGRFVTHCLFNYQEKSVIFRTSDFRQKHGKFLKVPLNKVKWECKEVNRTNKLVSLVRMVVDSIQPNAKFGPNDHRKDTPVIASTHII